MLCPRMPSKTSSRNGVTVPMQVNEFARLIMLWMLTFVADPVMAEYITIMLINNKTAGMCRCSYGHAQVLMSQQLKYRQSSKIVSSMRVINISYTEEAYLQ